MNRNYNLKLDLQFRCNNSTMKFNQFDNNTSDFFMKISNGGKSFDIEKAIVVLAAIKPSGKVSSQFVEVENGLVYADLKTNMKDEIGTYTAKAMLVLEDERVVTDTISYEVEEDKIFALLNDTVEATEDFTLLTDMLNRLSTIEISEEQRMINEAERILSEENRKIEEAKRVETELIRQHEEADRAKYDAIRESNENIRKQNESIRLSNETNRIDEEAKRVEEENKRKLAEEERKANYDFMTEDEERRRSEANAHKEAEILRVQAETNRVNEEVKRRTTEQARVSAENTRVSNENTRETNEIARKSNETQRIEAETQRKNRYNSFIVDAEANANEFENYTNTAKAKEEERKANELDRKTQEDRRVSNEVERISNENSRKANEVVREKNEASRQNTFTNKVNEVDKKIVELNTTKDNFVSSVNTKVDTKISELDTAKSDMTNTVTNKIDEVENRFNALTSKQQQDAEVIDARDGETSLKARLDRDVEKAKQVYVNVEGGNISTDSSVGYLKDVEILGNTIQDASNLADIRSVGDTVEGQELYEIPVLSVGKNLFDLRYIVKGKYITDAGVLGDSGNYHWSNYIKIKPNVAYSRNNTLNLFCYDKDFKPIGNKINTATFTTPNDAKYIAFTLAKDSEPNIQLEEGTVATSYEPYQEDKLTILSPVQLEKVGDVADRLICKDGVWGVEKNVKTYYFDGSEKWSRTTFNNGGVYFKTTVITDNLSATWNILCNNAVGKQMIASYDDLLTYAIYFDAANGFRITGADFQNMSSSHEVQSWVISKGLYIKYQTTQPQFIPLPRSQQVKLRTFANKTNISFGCEIEGTIKAQVPKSLGATVNTHTEQISNLNKELDRVKKLEESTVSTVTTESDFTTVEATSNGYFEDVKLEGKTLVNCLNVEPNVYTTSLHKSEIVNGYHKLTMLADGDLMWDLAKTNDLNLFKPSTYYTFIVDVKTNTTQSTEPIRANTSLNCMFTNGGSSNSYIKLSELNQTGVFIYKYKSEPNFTINNIRLKMANAKNGGVLEYRMVILEGDHTQNPPAYFEGLKSVGDTTDEVSVESVKGDGNLFDVDKIVSNYTEYFKCNDYIKYSNGEQRTYLKQDFEPNTQYSFTIKASNSKPTNIDFICRYTDGTYDKFIIPNDTANSIYTKTFTSNANKSIEYFGSFYSDGSIITVYLDGTCINKGTTPKPYTSHQSDKKRLLYYNNETQSWEKPILRQWDSIEKHADGKYYYHQRSAEIIFDGSSDEGWYSDGNTELNCKFRSTLYSDIKGYTTSDRFNTTNWNVYNVASGEEFLINGENGINVTILKSKLSTQDVQGFKQWLQANPVTVVYQLAQEKVYECTNIDLITYNGETNYIVESGAIAPKSILKVHNNISNVVSLLQKKVSLLESNITSYIITQNRLMLASRYNADTVSFKVDVASYNNSFEYDNDLYELILNNILVGKDNYNREYIENLIIFYWMDFVISDEMYITLFEIIEEQHNPKVIEDEAPIE